MVLQRQKATKRELGVPDRDRDQYCVGVFSTVTSAEVTTSKNTWQPPQPQVKAASDSGSYNTTHGQPSSHVELPTLLT